jgi:hypothetical protein
MENEFIPYKQALALKELGFDESCLASYVKETKEFTTRSFADFYKDQQVLAPLYQQAFRWFREKYKLSGTPQYFTGGFYCYTINDMKDTEKSNRLFTEFETHEEAELACLIKLIEIIKIK